MSLSRLSLLSILAAFTLAGCQSVPPDNPFQYRFSTPGSEKVCLYVSEGTTPMVAANVRTALEEKGMVVTEVDSVEVRDCDRCVRFTSSMGGWSGASLVKAWMEFARREGDRVITQGIVTMSTAPVTTAVSVSTEDQMISIRSMVDRLFPEPVLWNAP